MLQNAILMTLLYLANVGTMKNEGRPESMEDWPFSTRGISRRQKSFDLQHMVVQIAECKGIQSGIIY